MKVVVSEKAQSDLRTIAHWLAAIDHPNPIEMAEELRAAAMSVGARPFLRPIATRYSHLELRRLSHGKYAIFHRVDEERGEVVIEHVVHGARDLDALFGGPANDR